MADLLNEIVATLIVMGVLGAVQFCCRVRPLSGARERAQKFRACAEKYAYQNRKLLHGQGVGLTSLRSDLSRL
jgi:hypothetical protein